MTADQLVDVTKKAMEQINKYHKLRVDNGSIVLLMEMRRKLIGYNASISTELAAARKNYHISYGKRKIAEARVYRSHREAKHKLSIKDAEAQTLLDIEEMYESEKAWEGLYSELYAIVEAIVHAMEAMKQDIATIKKEREMEQGSQ